MRSVLALAMYAPGTGPMKVFTMSGDCTYTNEEEGIKRFDEGALEAARPVPAPAAHPPIMRKGSYPYPHRLLVPTICIGHC